MGSALFVVLNRELEGIDTSMNGKALARNERRLTVLAESLGVPDLWSFYGENPEDIAAILEIDGDFDEMDESPEMPDNPGEQWFAPSEGLAVVRALRDRVEASPETVEDAAEVAEDLKEIERILTAAAAHGANWNLAVDF